ncbi:MAG: hypothetical protein JWO38_2136 [Gemmataceae bacterium]|nr:hypothetical protein [Gemmataceae bacterium]
MFHRTVRALAVSAAMLTAAVTALVVTPTTAHADPIGGLKGGTYVVEERSSDSFVVTLRAGEITRIRLSGDGDTCLELRVCDENGNLVASDTLGGGDDRKVFIKPKWTGKFKVKVTNIGPMANKYRIVLD